MKRVTENQGKKTSGVDKELWLHLNAKYQAIKEIKVRDYCPNPLQDGSYSEKNGKRPLVSDYDRYSDAHVIQFRTYCK